jgi:threonine/homoserine/homoserine lactone efflux protein
LVFAVAAFAAAIREPILDALLLDPMLFLRGIAIGFAVAAPIGPVGILCIRKALADGRLAALVAGLGAALADTAFGAVAALGLGAVTDILHGQTVALKLIGGVFMIGLGLHSWRSAAVDVEPVSAKGGGMWADFVSTFFITITNPGTILGVAGVFAALGPSGRPEGAVSSGLLIAGVFCGSTLWWLVLSSAASAARTRFTPRRMVWFNHSTGAMLMVFGVAAIASLAF